MPSPTYNYNPTPRAAGRGIYGAVPGVIDMPQPARDLGVQIPGLQRINSSAASALRSGFQGQLSDATLNELQDSNAGWAIGAGMPGIRPGGMAGLRLARNIGKTSEQLQNQAFQNYGPFANAVSSTQTVNPALQYEIGHQNAVYGAAPDPTQAGSHAEQLFREYMNRIGGGGPGGGTARFGAIPSGDFGARRDTGGGGGNTVGWSTGGGTVSGGVERYPAGAGGTVSGSSMYPYGNAYGGSPGGDVNDFYNYGGGDSGYDYTSDTTPTGEDWTNYEDQFGY